MKVFNNICLINSMLTFYSFIFCLLSFIYYSLLFHLTYLIFNLYLRVFQLFLQLRYYTILILSYFYVGFLLFSTAPITGSFSFASIFSWIAVSLLASWWELETLSLSVLRCSLQLDLFSRFSQVYQFSLQILYTFLYCIAIKLLLSYL